MQARIRLNNIEESGYSINAHIREISNGFIVNESGKERSEDDLAVATQKFKDSAIKQKEEIKTTLQDQINKMQAALDNVDIIFDEAMAEAEKDIKLFKANRTEEKS